MTITLEELIERHEGFVPHAYQDSEGYWTVGIGIMIDERRGGGLSYGEAQFLLRNRLMRTKDELDQNIPWWRRLSHARRMALTDMAYNMGVPTLMKFKNMLAALENGEYTKARREALNSKWAKQVGPRAHTIARMLETDQLPA